MPSVPCVFALDLGTTSVSAIAVDQRGQVRHVITRNHRADVPGLPAGRAEQNPLAIRGTALDVLRELAQRSGGDPVCLGLTGQMHGVVLLDAARAPVSNLITWQDRRALETHPVTGRPVLQMLAERCDEADLQRAGCRLSPGFLGTTLFALRETGQLPASTRSAALLIDWFASQLTGNAVITDRSNAASTGLYDLERDQWSTELLSAARTPAAWLPRVGESGAPIGGLDAEIAPTTGLPAGLPVCNAIGDNQAAMVGSIPAGEDVVHINIGTGGQFSRIVERYCALPGLETRYLPEGRYMLVGAGLAGGDALAWVQRTLAASLRSCGVDWTDDEVYHRLDQLMAAAPPDAEGLLCEPYFRGTRQDPQRRGTFSGVSNDNFTPGNIGRAVLNGIAAAMVQLYSLASSAGPWPVERIIATGNAVRRNPLLIQRFADCLRLPVDLPVHREEAAYGAALLAGARTGFWPGLEDAGRCIRHERVAEPRS